jgi:hypothetical protein
MLDLERTYRSCELFPLFRNRLLTRSRPEYAQLLEWLGLPADHADPVHLLGLTEGRRKTDELAILPCPTAAADGMYRIKFLAHGIRHLPPATVEGVGALRSGDPLYLMLDEQNEHDGNAVCIRTGDPVSLVGYCPRYLAADFRSLLQQDAPSVRVRVDRVNPDAPSQLRLLCRLETRWPAGFQPCSGDEFQPIRASEPRMTTAAAAGASHQA